MTSGRRIHPVPYAFEIVLLLNLIVVVAMAKSRGLAVGRLIVEQVPVVWGSALQNTLLGIGLRALLEWRRGRARDYFAAIRTVGWLSDTLRLFVNLLFTVYLYGFVKLTVPIFHPRLFDRELWEADRMIFGGYSPNIFVLSLFSNSQMIRFFDWTYARIFFGSLIIAFAFVLSHPSRRIRIAFINGHTLLWLAGAWLYLLVPSLGPAFVFPEVWFEYARYFTITHYFQVKLMLNYQNVLKIAAGQQVPVSIALGIGAFPSLHVAFQMFVFLWMRRLWVYGQVVFGLFLLMIVLGSMVTGWHYFIDAVAGIVLAVACYVPFARLHRVPRWIALTRRET